MGFYDDALKPSDDQPSGQSTAAPAGTYSDALMPAPEQPEAPAGKVVWRGSVLPLSRTDRGETVVDWGSGLPGALASAVTLPGRAMRGEVPMGLPGSTDPNRYNAVIPEAVNFAQMFGPINPAVRSGDKVIPGVATNIKRPVREAPPTSELFATGGRQMDQFESLPYRVDPSSLAPLAQRIEDQLISKGVFRDNAKGIYNTLDSMRAAAQPQPPGTTVHIGPASLHALRQNIGNYFGVQGEHQLAPAIAQAELDKFIAKPPEGSILAGPFAAAYGADLFSRARGNLAAGYRGEAIDDLVREIDLKTAGAHSGRNLDNTTRQKITQLVLDDKRTKGWLPSEVTDLEGKVYGDALTNRLRSTSKVLGGGGGLGGFVSGTTGGVVGGTVGTALGVPPWVAYPAGAAIPPWIGSKLGDWGAARTLGGLRAVDEASRRRSPLFQEQPLLPPQAPSAVGRDAIARTLMLGTRPQPPPPQYYDPNRYDLNQGA